MRQFVLLFLVLGLASAQYSPALAKKACSVAKLAGSPDCMQCQQALKDIANFQIPKQKLQGVTAYNQEANSIFVAFRGTKEH